MSCAPWPKWRRARLALSALLLPASLFSCATTAVAPGAFPLESLKKESEARVAMAGTIRITQAENGKSLTAPGVLLLQWPDKLRLEVQDPVGSTLFLLVIEGGRFWLYNQERKENLSGPVKSLPTGVSLPFNSEDLVRVLLARPRLEAFTRAVVKANSAEATTGKTKEFLRWDASRYQPEEWSREPAGQAAVTARYEEFAAKGGVLYPTKIRLNRENQRSALVVWDEWETTIDGEKKLFQIPPSRQFGRPTKALP